MDSELIWAQNFCQKWTQKFWVHFEYWAWVSFESELTLAQISKWTRNSKGLILSPSELRIRTHSGLDLKWTQNSHGLRWTQNSHGFRVWKIHAGSWNVRSQTRVLKFSHLVRKTGSCNSSAVVNNFRCRFNAAILARLRGLAPLTSQFKLCIGYQNPWYRLRVHD